MPQSVRPSAKGACYDRQPRLGWQILMQCLLACMLSCTLGALAAAAETGPGYYVFFKKPQDWQRVFLYTWYVDGQKNIETSGPWPGKALSDVGGWYRGFIEENTIKTKGRPINIVFNNAAGQQTADLSRAGNGWYVWKENGQLVDRWYDLNPDEKLFNLLVTGGKGSGRYSAGSLVKVEAESADGEPGIFLGWQGPDAALLSDPKQKYGQLQMPARDVKLDAQFESLASGARQYGELCAGCHGAAGEGRVGPSLLLSDERCPSCRQENTLIDRISRTMPAGAVGTCTGECARSIARYIRFDLNEAPANGCDSQTSEAGRRQVRLLSKREFANTIRALFGIEDLEAFRFWPEPGLVKGYNNNAEASVASDRHVLVFAQAAEEISKQRSIESLGRMGCGTDRACLLESAALKIFREPLDPAGQQKYLALWQAEGSQKVLEAMLQSPRFLYRSELGSFVAPSNVYVLSNYEIASAMSYGLTGFPPDATLLAQAADGSLKKAETRRSEALRLLQSPEARATFADFALQWLGVNGLPFVTRDDANFNLAIRRDMLEETERFMAELVFDQGASVAELYRAESSAMSRALARYYGLTPPAQDWDRVSGLGGRRGLLGQGSVLASYANSEEASPIKRGVFVRNRLLCQDLPPPPANVDTTIPPPAPGLTIRERLARHVSQGQQSDGSNACFSCHQYIDKVGFAFEAYDATARYRDFYPEKPSEKIDLSGEVKGLESLADPTAPTFRDQRELGDILAQSPRAKQCFGSQYFRYFAGRIEEPADQCSLGRSQEILTQDRSILSFMAALVAADSFIYRK